MFLDLSDRRPNGDFNFAGTYYRSDAGSLGINDAKVIGQSVLQFVSLDNWQEITRRLIQGGEIRDFPLEFVVPIGRVQERTDWRLKIVNGQPLIYAEATMIKVVDAIDDVMRITHPNDIYTDKPMKLRQNNISTHCVPLLDPPMAVTTRDVQAFINLALSAAEDYLEPYYWVDTHPEQQEPIVTFVCKAPYARYAAKARKALIELPLGYPVYFQLWTQGAFRTKDRERLIKKGRAYFDQPHNSNVRAVPSITRTIMPTLTDTTGKLSNAMWSGEAVELNNPRFLNYWEHLLVREPLIASVYLISPHEGHKILAMGARQGWGQVNGKTQGGVPAALNKTIDFLDTQIREPLQNALSQVKDDQDNIPVALDRVYHDTNYRQDFGFTETVQKQYAGNILRVVRYSKQFFEELYLNCERSHR